MGVTGALATVLQAEQIACFSTIMLALLHRLFPILSGDQ